jgi:hypothetical protein
LVSLSTDVSGSLPLAAGGTGVTTAPAAGQYLRSTGTGWAASAIQAGDVPSLSGSYVDLSSTQTLTGAKTFNNTVSFNNTASFNNAVTVTTTTASAKGVTGVASASTGTGVGVYGSTASLNGIAGVFNNTAAGKILSGQNNSNTNEVFSVDGSGNVVASGMLQTGTGLHQTKIDSSGVLIMGTGQSGSTFGNNPITGIVVRRLESTHVSGGTASVVAAADSHLSLQRDSTYGGLVAVTDGNASYYSLTCIIP